MWIGSKSQDVTASVWAKSLGIEVSVASALQETWDTVPPQNTDACEWFLSQKPKSSERKVWPVLRPDSGDRFFEADSGEQALRLFESGEKYDLILIDFSMPGVNGAQLKAARAVRPEFPIVVAPGYAELPPSTDIKPYNQDESAKEIAKALSQRPARTCH